MNFKLLLYQDFQFDEDLTQEPFRIELEILLNISVEVAIDCSLESNYLIILENGLSISM